MAKDWKKEVSAVPDTIVLPHNEEAEASLLHALTLGGVLADTNAVYDTLPVEAFYNIDYQAIYVVCRKLFLSGKRVDSVSVRIELADDHQNAFAAVCNPLHQSVGHSLLDLADILSNNLLARQSIEVMYRGIGELSSPAITSLDAPSVISGVGEALNGVISGSATTDVGELAADIVDEVFDRWTSPTSDDTVSTGILPLDRMLDGGFHKGNMIVVAGRASMGKTSVCLSFARKAAIAGTPVLYIAMEQSADELTRKLLLSFTSATAEEISGNRLTDKQKEEIAMGKEVIKRMPLYFYCQDSLTAAKISTIVRRYRIEHQIDMVVVDLLGTVRPTSDAPRFVQIGEVSRALKAIAVREQIPLLAATQINREAAKSESKAPHLHNLSDSGSIEQDADVVLMVHRPHYYDASNNNYRGIGQFLVRKNRMGGTGTIYFKHTPDMSKISECPIEELPSQAHGDETQQ
jgi:replicative DNA helicase